MVPFPQKNVALPVQYVGVHSLMQDTVLKWGEYTTGCHAAKTVTRLAYYIKTRPAYLLAVQLYITITHSGCVASYPGLFSSCRWPVHAMGLIIVCPHTGWKGSQSGGINRVQACMAMNPWINHFFHSIP